MNIINKNDIIKFLENNDIKNITLSKNSNDFMVVNKNKDEVINIIPKTNHFLKNNDTIKNVNSNIVRYTIYDFDLPVRFLFNNNQISYTNSKIDILRIKANFKLIKTIDDNKKMEIKLENDKTKDLKSETKDLKNEKLELAKKIADKKINWADTDSDSDDGLPNTLESENDSNDVIFYSRGEILDITIDNYNNVKELDDFKSLKEVKYSGITNEFFFNVFNINYLITDLRKMLIARYFPWLDKKYTKRLHRYFYLITMTMYTMKDKNMLVDEYYKFKIKNYLLEARNELEKYCEIKINDTRKLEEYYNLSNLKNLEDSFITTEKNA